MNEICFWEYAIQLKKCCFTKYQGIGIKIGDGLYRTKFYHNKKYIGNERTVNINNFEKIESYRILSFNDDVIFYNKLLLNEYENMIHRSKTKIQKQELFLTRLKQSMD